MMYLWVKVVIIAMCIFATNNVSAKDVVSWKKVVPESTRIGVLTHRYYPAIFSDGIKRTHFGVDILGPRGTNKVCGKAIYPLLPGFVVSTKTAPGGGLGNAVLMRHPGRADDGGDLYTIYLHMEKKPEVTSGWVDETEPIGYVGKTGFANGVCHVHFEIRNFFHDSSAGGKGWFHEKLSGIYATGDYSNKSWVLSDWEDPENFFVPEIPKTKEIEFFYVYEEDAFGQEYGIGWSPVDVPCVRAKYFLIDGQGFSSADNSICYEAFDKLAQMKWLWDGTYGGWRKMFFESFDYSNLQCSAN